MSEPWVNSQKPVLARRSLIRRRLRVACLALPAIILLMGFQCGSESVRSSSAWHMTAAEDDYKTASLASREGQEVCARALCVSITDAIIENRDHYSIDLGIVNQRENAVSTKWTGMAFATPTREAGKQELPLRPWDVQFDRPGRPTGIYRRENHEYSDGLNWRWCNPADGSDTHRMDIGDITFEVPAGQTASLSLAFSGTPREAVLSIRFTDAATQRDEWFHFWLQPE